MSMTHVSLHDQFPHKSAVMIENEIAAGLHVLDGDEQERFEVLTGKRLQQRARPVEPGGPVTPPVELTVTGLTPDTVAIGEPSFDIHVMGTGFVDGCTINFAGQDEPTTFVSDTEVTTGINMPLWLGPDAVPVFVKNPDDTASNAMDFTFTAAAPGPDAPPARSAKPEAKVEPKKDDKDAKADHKK